MRAVSTIAESGDSNTVVVCLQDGQSKPVIDNNSQQPPEQDDKGASGKPSGYKVL